MYFRYCSVVHVYHTIVRVGQTYIMGNSEMKKHWHLGIHER